jgi:EAL domain-containing protein (putative c-di-GMP-specific phosphodiesterase class I)
MTSANGERAGSSLAAAIVQISHTLGLIPIAEGVECQEQADALGGLGCDLAQGFHLGRPVDAAAARALIARAGSRSAA